MSRLAVKEVFATLQGEGSQAGRPAVFVRLSGCNLWSGLESGRESGTGGCAAWCDTQFVGGSRWEVPALISQVFALMPDWVRPFVVISGGEPCLQLRTPQGERFVDLLVAGGADVAVETNGTVFADVLHHSGIHVTVSPKVLRASYSHEDVGESLAHVIVRRGTDLKVVVPQWDVRHLRAMSEWDFEHRFVQPLDDGQGGPMHPNVRWFAERLGWKVSVQTHKLLGLP